MNISVKKSSINGKVSCPPSKTFSHRALILGGLSTGTSKLENVLMSRDTIATINCCKLLGIEFKILDNKKNIPSNQINDTHSTLYDKYQTEVSSETISQNSATIQVTSIGGKNGYITPEDVMNAENSGTSLRLLTSMCSLVKSGYTILTGDASLRKRPMNDLIKALNNLGVECFSSNLLNHPPIVVKGGGIPGGIAEISGKISSQFVSSLLLSGIYSDSPITLKIIGEQVSKPYIDSTIAMMEKFGVTIERDTIYKDKKSKISCSNLKKDESTDNQLTEIYKLPSQGEYEPCSIKIPGDFSTAALLIAAGILGDGEITIENLDFSLPQGDVEIINIVKAMGGILEIDDRRGIVKVSGGKTLNGGKFNLKNTPDLLPVVSILALKSNKETSIGGILHARYKETDRVSNIATELVKFGATVTESIDELIIKPPSIIKTNSPIKSFNDHRLFMAFTIASLSTGNYIIEDAESVDVSYPNFLPELKKLGAEIHHL